MHLPLKKKLNKTKDNELCGTQGVENVRHSKTDRKLRGVKAVKNKLKYCSELEATIVTTTAQDDQNQPVVNP